MGSGGGRSAAWRGTKEVCETRRARRAEGSSRVIGRGLGKGRQELPEAGCSL